LLNIYDNFVLDKKREVRALENPTKINVKT